MNPQGAATADPAELLRLAYRCTRQVSFSWTPGDGRLRFGDEVAEFLAPGLLNDVRTGEDLVQRVNPADRKQLNDALVRALKGARDGDSRAAGIQEALFRLRSIDDRWHWIAMRGIVTATASDGRGARISGVLIDETERETERREAVRMRNLYAMQSAINRAISHCAERHALLTQVCEVAVAHGDFALAWVGLNGLRSQTVEVFTQAGGSTDYPARIAAVLRSGEMQQSRLIDRAMQACAPVIHNDLTALQPAPEWLPHALEAGFRSVGCLPLFEEGEPIGGLTLYSTEVDHFDTDMVTLLQGMGSDVSHALGHLLIKRQQTEANRQLSEANRQLQTAMAASLDGMLVVAGDGSIVEMNPAARDLLGCGNEPQAGDSELLPAERNLFSTFTPLRLRAARKAQVRRLLKPEAASTMATLRRIETHLCRRDGFEVPAELVLTPLEPGENGLLMVTVRDLTALHRQRDQLIDAARRNEQLIEHSPDSVLVHIDETILLVNSKLRQLLGARNAQQLIGSHLRNIVHPADAQRLRARKHADGTDWLADQAIEIRLLRLDGAEIEVDLLAGDTEFQGQRARQVVLRDIGERKRLERMQHSQQAVLALIAARQPLATVLREVARAVERNAPGVRCAVFVAAENGQAFVSAFSSSDQMADPLQTEDLRQFAADSPSAICRAASLRAPVFVEDAQHDGSTARVRAVRRALGAKAAGAWPLLSLAGELMGVIYLTLPHTGQPGQQVLQLIAQYTDLTAVAIDNDRQAARIRHLAQHDVLTSLPNRATFKDLLDHAIDRAQRRGSLLAAMFVDLDRFKLINDTFGHGTGDAVLCKVAERLAGAVRSCDRVARMGGDEFILLVDELASPEAASDVANRVLQALAMPVSLGGHEHELSGSIGIALYPRDGEDSETLIKHADNAMYRAKQSGRNGCAFFNEADTVHSTERFAMQAQLRRALQKREFVLHYQPRVDMRSGHVRGLEALVRWQHPERGLVMPGHFIDVAEESGLIVALGREVMEMAFADVPRLLAASGGRVTTAINLSAMQIAHEGFVDEIRELVARTGVDPRTVEFEITETMLMRQPEQARQVIETLRQMGFSFSLDDFGTGYSSLTYLKRFPVQCVKIDRSFVKDIPGDASDLAITRAIIAMAHSLSLHVVAEGVETSEQLEALRRMNCDQYQGYFFSKPVPIDQVVALMNIDGAPDPALFTQALVLPKPKRLAAIPAG